MISTYGTFQGAFFGVSGSTERDLGLAEVSAWVAERVLRVGAILRQK